MWWRRVAWQTAIVVPFVIGLGLFAFAWRTWHYTGIFSLFYGTQRQVVAIWQVGMSFRTVMQRLSHSVLLVLTVNDPPRFDIYALPILAGAAIAVASVAGVPRLRDLPASAVLFFFASIAGGVCRRRLGLSGPVLRSRDADHLRADGLRRGGRIGPR